MWLLESREAFDGRRLWLRPGKTYLFGRTAAEPGQLAISHHTISRKHLTITVDDVEEGHAHHLSSRSKLTIEDLATKIGTVVNGEKIKGGKYVVNGEEAEITMGKCPNAFRITWFSVVFTFSFTNKEIQTQPLITLRERFEHLDIKLLTDYNVKWTTHVVSRKRNTAKGLQALINGKHIVTETFLDAIVQAAEQPENGDVSEPSRLEQDFERYWPDAMQHLPPPGGEPVQHPDSTYSPDLERKDVFEGYTFIFYDQTQYNNLLAPITDGCGKALLENVVPSQTQVDDFVRYVKSVAGEKGLGSFDDGSEGRGVVLVRYLPAKGDQITWYAEFITEVSLRLDHRPIEQSEFLEAILIKDASILRRPLEVETGNTQQSEAGRNVGGVQLGNDEGQSGAAQPVEQPQPPSRRVRSRRPVQRRFAGFDDDDVEMDSPPSVPVPGRDPVAEDEGGLFVSQGDHPGTQDDSNATGRSPRKRQASPLPEDDLMDGMAPAAARFKRQRLERGDNFASPSPEPAAESAAPQPKKKKAKKEIDVLAMAAQHREQEEARARAEREDLANLPDDADLAEIRRLNIVEEISVRQLPDTTRTREQDIADGRWNPKWNGIKNFKKFRSRGETRGRQPARVIVPLAVVKNKEFGVGDDYWLEEEGSQRKKRTVSQPALQESSNSAPSAPLQHRRVVLSDSSDDNEDGSGAAVDSGGPSTRNSGQGQATPQNGVRSQSSTQTSRVQGKRAAPQPAKGQPAKRSRPARRAAEAADSDDSDDELKFRFGKRR